MTPTRPILRYYGGKFRLAPWVVSHFPAHRCYVEPFGGAASVLMHKQPAYCEVYNDRDAEIVGLFRVLHDPAQAKDLANLLRLTPFARDEFAAAYQPGGDAIERARRLVVRSFMGHSSAGATRDARTGFRRDGLTRRGTTPVSDFRGYPNMLQHFTERLDNVIIENRPAIEVMTAYDTRGTLAYLDPPYPKGTRTDGGSNGYRHEMSDDDHRQLGAAARAMQGMVIISGYACPLYDRELYPDWLRVATTARTNKGNKRTEVLWINPAAESAMQGQLCFAEDEDEPV